MSDSVSRYYPREVYEKALDEFDVDPMFGLLHVHNNTHIDGIHALSILWAVEEIKILRSQVSELKAENEFLKLQHLAGKI